MSINDQDLCHLKIGYDTQGQNRLRFWKRVHIIPNQSHYGKETEDGADGKVTINQTKILHILVLFQKDLFGRITQRILHSRSIPFVNFYRLIINLPLVPQVSVATASPAAGTTASTAASATTSPPALRRCHHHKLNHIGLKRYRHGREVWQFLKS